MVLHFALCRQIPSAGVVLQQCIRVPFHTALPIKEVVPPVFVDLTDKC